MNNHAQISFGNKCRALLKIVDAKIVVINAIDGDANDIDLSEIKIEYYVPQLTTEAT